MRAVINVYLFIEHVIGNEAAASQIKHYVIHTSLMCIHRWAQYSHTSSYIVDKQPLDNDTHQLVRLKALTCKDSLLSNSGAIYDTGCDLQRFELSITGFRLEHRLIWLAIVNMSCWIFKFRFFFLFLVEFWNNRFTSYRTLKVCLDKFSDIVPTWAIKSNHCRKSMYLWQLLV